MVTKQTVNTCHRNSKHRKYHVTVVNEVNTLRITSGKWLKQHPYKILSWFTEKGEKFHYPVTEFLKKIDTLSRYNNGMRDETYIFNDRL